MTACGGSSGAAPQIAVFGDSLFSGRGLAVPPVIQMREALPGVTIHDFSEPGMRAFEAGELMRNKLAELRPTVAAILFGGADVIGLTSPSDFEVAMRARFAEARSWGCLVMFKTIIRHPDYLPRLQALNTVIWQLALELNVPVADVYALPTGEFLEDRVHPGPVYSTACTEVLIDTAKLVLSQGAV